MFFFPCLQRSKFNHLTNYRFCVPTTPTPPFQTQKTYESKLIIQSKKFKQFINFVHPRKCTT